MAKLTYKTKAIVFLALLFFMFAFRHPFYLSVTDLKYNAKEKVLQGSVKIFVNDLESALRKQEGKMIDLIHPKDSLKTKQLLEIYLKKHLTFKINNKSLNYKLLGFEQEQEALWLYVDVASCPLPKKVDVENTILYDFQSTQSNIVHIEVNGDRKSLKADNPDRLLQFAF